MSRKPTRQQTAVAEQLASRGDFVSAQQLHAALTASGASAVSRRCTGHCRRWPATAPSTR